MTARVLVQVLCPRCAKRRAADLTVEHTSLWVSMRVKTPKGANGHGVGIHIGTDEEAPHLRVYTDGTPEGLDDEDEGQPDGRWRTRVEFSIESPLVATQTYQATCGHCQPFTFLGSDALEQATRARGLRRPARWVPPMRDSWQTLC